jgi:hypothetical protein
MAIAALRTASDSNMEIPELSYTDDTVMITVTVSRTESSNMIKRHSDSETVTKTTVAADQQPSTLPAINEDTNASPVYIITHAVAADQQPSTVPAINEDTNASSVYGIIGIVLVIVIGVWKLCYRKHEYKKVPPDPEGQLQDESNNKKLFCSYSCSPCTTN